MWGVVANVKSDRVLRLGARVWILLTHGDAEKPLVRGHSIGGRVVEKHIPYKRLEKFRPRVIPDHIVSKFHHWHRHETKEEAAEQADALTRMWSGIQFYSREGEQLQAGEPASRAFHRGRDK